MSVGRLGLWIGNAAFIAALGLCLPTAASGRQQNSPSATAQAQQQQAQVNASRAAKDVNVGTFYMHKGDDGAAISRFEEAVQLDPKNAKAQLLLGEAYEKQHNWEAAAKTYQDYLNAFPTASDEKKIHKKIQELSHKRD
ncbi:MAG: tetratricopeptide repeat protein [Candidatus Acidiferrales bacterium]